ARQAGMCEAVVFATGVNQRRVRGEGGINSHQWWQFFPRHRESGEIKCLDGFAFPDNHGYGLAAETRFPVREHRLICKRRNYAITVDAGHIFRSEDRLDSGMRCDELIEIAEGEAGAMVRTVTCLPGDRRVCTFISSEDLGSVNFALAVEAHQTRAHSLATLRRCF